MTRWKGNESVTISILPSSLFSSLISPPATARNSPPPIYLLFHPKDSSMSLNLKIHSPQVHEPSVRRSAYKPYTSRSLQLHSLSTEISLPLWHLLHFFHVSGWLLKGLNLESGGVQEVWRNEERKERR